MRHQVYFKVDALISIEVDAESFDNAIEVAKKRMNKSGIFISGVEFIDGSYQPNGVMEDWKEKE